MSQEMIVQYALPVILLVIKVLLVLVVVLTFVAYLTLVERKVLGWIQVRIGPNRVGPWGLLQPLADGAKLLLKEEITVAGANKADLYPGPFDCSHLCSDPVCRDSVCQGIRSGHDTGTHG